MGKRGPKRTSTDILEKRGSPVAAERRKEDTAAKRKAKRAKRNKTDEVIDLPSLDEIEHIARTEIRGYDPWQDSDEYEFDPDLALDVVRFFHERLVHVKGSKAGKPFYLEKWQQAIVANLFGWIVIETGLRRYQTLFMFVPRKNGKTPFAAGLILYVLENDAEPGAEIYGAAAEYKQASFVFEHVQGMIAHDERMAARLKVYKGQSKAVQAEDDLTTYRVISSEAYSKHGQHTHMFIVDELHAMPTPDLVDTLETSVAGRDQPLKIYITTSDFEREGSICNETYDHACKVRDGIIKEPDFLPVIYEAARDADWTSVETWKAANPNLGVSVKMEYMEKACKKAQEIARLENLFKRLHLNIRTEQSMRWFGMDKWDACSGIVSEEALYGRECFGGLDLASEIDIAAFVLVFPDDGNYLVLPFFWVPRDNAIERERKDRVPYVTWAREGFLRLTDGNIIDFDVIRRDINELNDKYNIGSIGFDRFNAMQLGLQLKGDGLEIEKFGQGYFGLSGPSKRLEALVNAGMLQHGGHPVLRWMASNVAITMDAAESIKPARDKSREKIDGIVALVMALGMLMTAPEKKRSVYETRGPVFV